MLQQVHGSCERVRHLSDVPTAVASFLDSENRGNIVTISPNSIFKALDWGKFETSFRAAKKEDTVSITLAYAGIAETGTVAMVSSPESPTTLNFLPEVSIVILPQSSLLNSMEDLWQRPGLDNQPRALNFITGPSKTADIEQTIVYGAHGPRKFHVILVEHSDSDVSTG